MNTMINEKYPESELTGKIIGCCMEVHRILGNARLTGTGRVSRK